MIQQRCKTFYKVTIKPNIGVGALVDVCLVSNENNGGRLWKGTLLAMKLGLQELVPRGACTTEFSVGCLQVVPSPSI